MDRYEEVDFTKKDFYMLYVQFPQQHTYLVWKFLTFKFYYLIILDTISVIMEVLGKCSGLAPLGPRAKGVQFYCPSSTYPAIVLLGLYSIAIFLQGDPVCKKIAPLQSLGAKKLHTISLHFHKNCILKRI